MSSRDQPELNLGAVLRFIQSSQIPDYLDKPQRIALKKYIGNFKLQPDGKLYFIERQSVFGKKSIRQVVIEISEQRKIVQASHVKDYDARRHLGVEETYRECARNFYWPTQYADVTQFIRNCPGCRQQTHNGVAAASVRTKSSWTSFRPLPDTPTEERRKELAHQAMRDAQRGGAENPYLQPSPKHAEMLQRKARQQGALRSDGPRQAWAAAESPHYQKQRQDYNHNYRPTIDRQQLPSKRQDRPSMNGHSSSDNQIQNQWNSYRDPVAADDSGQPDGTTAAFSNTHSRIQQPHDQQSVTTQVEMEDTRRIVELSHTPSRTAITASELLSAARSLKQTVKPRENLGASVGRVVGGAESPRARSPPATSSTRHEINLDDIRRQAKSLKKTGAIAERMELPESESNRASKLEELFDIKIADEDEGHIPVAPPAPPKPPLTLSYENNDAGITSLRAAASVTSQRTSQASPSPPVASFRPPSPPSPAPVQRSRSPTTAAFAPRDQVAPPPPTTHELPAAPPVNASNDLPKTDGYVPKSLQHIEAPRMGTRKVSSSDDNERPSGVPQRPKPATITNKEFLEDSRPPKKNPLFEGQRRYRREERRKPRRESPTNSSTDSFYRRTPSGGRQRTGRSFSPHASAARRRESPSPERRAKSREFLSEHAHELRNARRFHTHAKRNPRGAPDAQQRNFMSSRSHKVRGYYREDTRRHRSPHPLQEQEMRRTRRGTSPRQHRARTARHRTAESRPAVFDSRTVSQRDPRAAAALLAQQQAAAAEAAPRFHATTAWGYPSSGTISQAAYNRLWWHNAALQGAQNAQQYQIGYQQQVAAQPAYNQWGWSEHF